MRLARTALDRLEVPGEARQAIEFLVRNHLAMSQVAFRRDLDDPHVVAQFAHLVGTEELLKMLCLMTLVDVEAVSTTHADAVEGRPALAALRRDLQPPDARLRRRAGAAGSGGIERGHRRPPRRHLGGGADAVPRGPAAPVSGAVRAGVDVSPRPPGARHPPRRGARVPREPRRRLGADHRHARQAVPVLEHRRRAVLLRHGHPSRPGDDDGRRPGARRLRVLRRAGLPAAEPRRHRGDHPHARPASSPAGSTCRRCCAAASAACSTAAGSASRRGCTSTTSTRRSTPSSRSSQTTPRDCCTASAG